MSHLTKTGGCHGNRALYQGAVRHPKQFREMHHLAVGTEFVVSFVGDEIRLTPLPMFLRTAVANAAGLLARRGQKGLRDEKSCASISKTLKAQDAATRFSCQAMY